MVPVLFINVCNARFVEPLSLGEAQSKKVQPLSVQYVQFRRRRLFMKYKQLEPKTLSELRFVANKSRKITYVPACLEKHEEDGHEVDMEPVLTTLEPGSSPEKDKRRKKRKNEDMDMDGAEGDKGEECIEEGYEGEGKGIGLSRRGCLSDAR
jgi:hypothetical protein